MRIGVFGGTFDPPHLGHLIVAQDAWLALGLDRVLFVPAAEPPHKRGRVATPPEVRLELVKAAVAGDDRFEACDIELRRSGPSYSVDTLRELHARHPGATFYFLLGSDQLREFGTWREPDELARLATIVGLSREGTEPAADISVRYHSLNVTRIDISASEIRRRAAADEPIRYLVPAGVEQLIRERSLYMKTGSPAAAPGVS